MRKMDVGVGSVYGKLKITGEVDPYINPNTGRRIRKVSYVCSCGTVGEAQLGHLRSGGTTSCGCVKRSCRITHGKYKTKLYGVYNSMIRRCNNPKYVGYKHYGGRGIEVCEVWCSGFEAFDAWAIENGYEEGLTLERVDVNKGYCPENCTWIPMVEQNLNKRMFSNNTSGVTGVSYNPRIKAWSCFWREGGVQRSSTFSIKKYGDGAKQMAIDKRKEMEKELGITNNDP